MQQSQEKAIDDLHLIFIKANGAGAQRLASALFTRPSPCPHFAVAGLSSSIHRFKYSRIASATSS